MAWKLQFTDEDGAPRLETFYTESHLNRHVQHNTQVRGLNCVVVPLFAAPTQAGETTAPVQQDAPAPSMVGDAKGGA
ncbi:hypothetical protein D3C71_1974060 [compost metagenome]